MRSEFTVHNLADFERLRCQWRVPDTFNSKVNDWTVRVRRRWGKLQKRTRICHNRPRHGRATNKDYDCEDIARTQLHSF